MSEQFTAALWDWLEKNAPTAYGIELQRILARAEAADRALSDPRETLAWRPIESAQKDGSGVVVGWEFNRFDAEVAKYQGGFWRTSDGEALFKPDHWLSLPASPEGPR